MTTDRRSQASSDSHVSLDDLRDASQGSGARELDLSSLMRAQDGNELQDATAHAAHGATNYAKVDDDAAQDTMGHADHGATQTMELSEANLAHFQETQAHDTLESASADLETRESAMADFDPDNEMADPYTLESEEEEEEEEEEEG